jgi:hypothetical protein
MHAPFALSPPGRLSGLLTLARRFCGLAGQRGSIRGQLLFVAALIGFGLAWKAGLLDGLMHPAPRP